MFGRLIGKVVVKKAKRALDEFYIEGFPTNIPLHREIVRDEDFKAGRFTTNYLDTKMDIFTLHSEDNIKEEEAKVENLKKLISTINSKNITTRH